MIPRKISLEGFLCYRDRQTLDLDGSDLWVFAGRNGSGKSSIFDAITFAFFNEHRGGGQNAGALINHDSDGFVVELDFDLLGHYYRIRRSLKRTGKSERQVFVREPGSDGPDRWRPVPETHSEKGFNEWVQRTLGLTHETFISSVLLLQGQADRLLSAKPKERFAVLAGVVDLERFQRLHKQADARRSSAKERFQVLRNQLVSMSLVEESDVEEAMRRTSEANDMRVEADAERARLEGLHQQARRWSALVGERDGASARFQTAQALLDESASIGRDLGRLTDIDAFLPTLRDAERWCGESRELESAAALREARRQTFVRDRTQTDQLIVAVEQRRAGLGAEVRSDEARRSAVADRIAQLGGPLERARAVSRQRELVRLLEVKAAVFAPNLQALLEALEALLMERIGVQIALPVLTRLSQERDQLIEAGKRAEESRLELTADCAEAGRMKRDRDVKVALREEAGVAAQEARDRATEARTLADQALKLRTRFEELGDATTCDRCGQPLDPEHVAEERERLGAEVMRSALQASQAGLASDASEGTLRSAESAVREADRKIQAVDERIAIRRNQLERAGRDAQAHREHCRQSYDGLCESFRLRVAEALPDDWSQTRYPTADDLAVLRSRTGEIEDVTARRDEAKKTWDDWRLIGAQLAQARHALAEAGDEGADVAGLEAEEAALKSEATALDRCLKEHEAHLSLAEENRRQLAIQAAALDAQAARIAQDEQAALIRTEAVRVGRERARASLPETWRARFDAVSADLIAACEAEGKGLRDSGVEARARELPHALARRDEARLTLERIGADLAAIPAEAHKDPAGFDGLLAECLQRSEEAVANLLVRTSEESELRKALERLRQLRLDVLAAERVLKVAETLATLLGREGLQRDLLREAEHGIVACANPILAEVSGGELTLRLSGGDSADPERILQLEAIERIGGRTLVHHVAFLSGSQRFRVAVSLALGIGQLARGLDRRIESVIIDEGFGSLDRVGRQEMIAQLNALRGCMARILLVSHQEEFFDAFSDGYHFERVDGATRVEPFHR